jgi:hypothetical protein
LGYGVAAYGLWGAFPLYWPLLEPAGAIEILAHRVLWSAVTMLGIVVLLRRTRQFRACLLDRRTRILLGLAALVITVNWATYIWGVNNGRVVETSLGYFINPLVTVLMGVAILGERLRRLQWVALGIASGAVLVLTLDYGRLPWVALVLAFSFGSYGLAKKTGVAGDGGVRRQRPGPRAAAQHDRHRDRDPADLFRGGRDPGVDGVARPAAVPRPGAAVRPRRALVRRGHADRPLDRLRPGVGGTGDLHGGGGQPPASPAATHGRGVVRHLIVTWPPPRARADSTARS